MTALRSLKLAFVLLVLLTIAVFFFAGDFNEQELTFWTRTRSRNVSLYVDAEPLLMPPQFCATRSYLLVVVHSHPSNFEARRVIRQTWGKRAEVGRGNHLYFLVGQVGSAVVQERVAAEAHAFGDVIQERFVDAYWNLTLKSVFMLKEVARCQNAKFLLKADVDLYVNMGRLLAFIRSRKSFERRMLAGRMVPQSRPIHDKGSHYYAPGYMYGERRYPNFIAGTGYLMSIDVVTKLYETSLKTPYFHLEDVYLTGICATKALIKIIHVPAFVEGGIPSNWCLMERYYVAHSFTPEVIRSFFNIRKDLGKICHFISMQEENSTKSIM